MNIVWIAVVCWAVGKEPGCQVYKPEPFTTRAACEQTFKDLKPHAHKWYAGSDRHTWYECKRAKISN